MANGRRQGAVHHERLLGSLGYGNGNAVGTDIADLGEEDVWSAAATEDLGVNDDRRRESLHDIVGMRLGRDHQETGKSDMQRFREDRRMGGLSLVFEDATADDKHTVRVIHQYRDVDNSGPAKSERHQVASSLPTSMPDCPRILRVESMGSLRGQDEVGDEAEWVPPHEYLARANAKNGRPVTNSVFEGVGRTLKGRDMRRVRDAVWSQTGFYG